MLRNKNEVDHHISEVCESNCYECSINNEVENYKEKSVVEKADLIIKKYIWNIRKWLERKKEIWKVVVHSMKGSSKKAIEVNNKLRLNVDKQQGDKSIRILIRHRWCRLSWGNHSCQNPHEK